MYLTTSNKTLCLIKDIIDHVNKWAIYLEKITAKPKSKNINIWNIRGTPEKCQELSKSNINMEKELEQANFNTFQREQIKVHVRYKSASTERGKKKKDNS